MQPNTSTRLHYLRRVILQVQFSCRENESAVLEWESNSPPTFSNGSKWDQTQKWVVLLLLTEAEGTQWSPESRSIFITLIHYNLSRVWSFFSSFTKLYPSRLQDAQTMKASNSSTSFLLEKYQSVCCPLHHLQHQIMCIKKNGQVEPAHGSLLSRWSLSEAAKYLSLGASEGIKRPSTSIWQFLKWFVCGYNNAFLSDRLMAPVKSRSLLRHWTMSSIYDQVSKAVHPRRF